MKYIKTFERVEKTKDLKKLFNHLVDVFSEYYAYQIQKYQNVIKEVLFYNTESKFVFSLKISFEDRHLIVSANDITTGICSYILHYFDTINGIKRLEKGTHRNYYSIMGKNVDNIINQISKDDFELKHSVSKFNI